MPSREHLLTVVEPTAGADTSTIDLARDTVARGGGASVVLLVSRRLRRDIAAFAEAEGLDVTTAEGIVLERLTDDLVNQVGPGTDVWVGHDHAHREVARHVTSATTSIAMPASLLRRRSARRAVAATGLDVVVTPPAAA